MSDQRIVLFCFAGREPNMELQLPFILRLLEQYPGMEYHAWNLTRNAADDKYVRALGERHERIVVHNQLQTPNDWPKGVCRKKLRRPRPCGCDQCRAAPYERVYRWYAQGEDTDAVYMKLDDDIVFIETERFGEVLDLLREHPSAVVSANVVNNVVSAKHDPELRQLIQNRRGGPVTQRDWFDLHADAGFARLCHDWFLENWERLVHEHEDDVLQRTFSGDVVVDEAVPYSVAVRSLPGERVSINTVAFTHATLCGISRVVDHPAFSKMGDEGAICNNYLPRILVSFRTAHLYFGSQRVAMTDAELDEYRARYAEVGRKYLGS